MQGLPGLDFQLGEDIDALREAVHDFAQAEIAPRAAEIDRSDQFMLPDAPLDLPDAERGETRRHGDQRRDSDAAPQGSWLMSCGDGIMLVLR